MPEAQKNKAAIVVKFRENISLPYEDELEQYFPSLKLMGWDAVKNMAPGCTFRKVCRAFTPGNTKTLFDLAAKRNPKLGAKRFFHHFVLDGVSTVKPEELGKLLQAVLQRLRGWPEVEYAYIAPKPLPPPTNGTVAIPNAQHYLKPPPNGINVAYALKLPGGDGTGQRVVDVEMGWELNHVGLLDAQLPPAPRVKRINTVNDPNWAWHGTGVLGILCGNNRSGVLGAAHNLTAAYVVGHRDTADIPAAIELAILSLMPGVDPTRLGDPGYLIELVNGPVLPQVKDGPVLLLEVQMPDPVNRLPMPAEIDPVVGDFIEIATAVGIVVVEAAANGGDGNGRGNLDQYPDKYRGTTDRILNPNFPTEFRDTGAILVGGARFNGTSTWDRDPISNFGNRVNCFAPGFGVFTLDATPGNPPTRSDFAGTSSASAIIAGAALALQGLALAHSGQQLSPSDVRRFLGDKTPGTNTPSAQPNRDLIGVMPNLERIATNRLGIVPPAPPTGVHVVAGAAGGAGGAGGGGT